MSAACPRCGSLLAAGAAVCSRCQGKDRGAPAAGDLQYGMVDLGGGADLGALPALDTDKAATGRRSAPKRPASGSVARKQPSGPVTPPGQRASASTSGGARSSASTASGARSSASMSGGSKAVARQSATSRSVAQPAAAAQARAATPDVSSYGRGMTLDEDPFNQGFDASKASAALELGVEPATRSRPQAAPVAEDVQASVPPRPQTPEQQRSTRVHEIAGYGPAPIKLTGTPGYCIRVVLRRRALAVELSGLSAHRKRADDASRDALIKLGEVIYGLRDDPRTAGLARQAAAVSDADGQVGQVEAQAHKRQQDTAREVARLDRDIARAEQDAAPLRQRESEIDAKLARLKGELRRVELLRRKAQGELDALEKQKVGVDLADRRAALQAERDARHGEAQTLGVEMRPLEDDLSELRRDLALKMRAIAGLQDDKKLTLSGLERAQQTQRVSYGSARGARAQALTALAQAAIKLGLGSLAAQETHEVIQSGERTGQRRQQEELYRAAIDCYDHRRYTQGLSLLLGSSLLLLLGLAAKILL
ncbi:MAG: hypothetical protein ACHQ53_02825 [Polyangiales bacterium]